MLNKFYELKYYYLVRSTSKWIKSLKFIWEGVLEDAMISWLVEIRVYDFFFIHKVVGLVENRLILKYVVWSKNLRFEPIIITK